MQLKVTSRLEERINARWLVWHPWVLSAARKKLPNIDLDLALEGARGLHWRRYIDILQHRIPERTILRRNLDDPRVPDNQYRIAVENALWHRAYRMGRTKGIHRSHKQIKQEMERNAHAI
jgi:hypothetical protein